MIPSVTIPAIISRTFVFTGSLQVFAPALLTMVGLAALSVSCGWYEHLSWRIRSGAEFIGVGFLVSMQTAEYKVKRTRRGGRHARARKLEAAALQGNDDGTDQTTTKDITQAQPSQSFTGRDTRDVEQATSSSYATQAQAQAQDPIAEESSAVKKKRHHSGGWRSKNARAKRKATYEAERALAQRTAATIPTSVDWTTMTTTTTTMTTMTTTRYSSPAIAPDE
ncbi:hypothetical protein EUX98_g9134 [Antrodiella citrinella]|uniref:Uncharacterized protein n=1 Tax=Antrodiella citrinella TaxID=2447956 RepID=A0A4S4M3N8_9APHY|nr:hypothetical protein EUX98_g9134 [Antrodiella citrinella]